MRTITVTEETFDRLFQRAMSRFEYDGYWLNKRGETPEEFKLTLMYKLLTETREAFEHLKKELQRLE